MYDQIYWPLCVGDTSTSTPPELVPEMARYTIFVDGISKAFASTGVRVGWAVGPVDLIERMSAILGHVGAWAPRAEQVATAALLDDPSYCAEYHATFIAGIQRRLDATVPRAERDEGEGTSGGRDRADGSDLPERAHPPVRPAHA